ncbi:hypothetical protein [Bradyrhizobium guangzhouense]|uniref:hypothetical protein n=1 Tax=Bradyrhizobium guangzhouense TaxID=1325095 RepID=UPI001009A325|nr:hypothetical protein [Bradyrhizobium guangzhouense]RXH16892.1 hypothetical protein EAS54_16075 [Bradyrhizobium guangzhouense]
MPKLSKETVIIVHGTWAAPAEDHKNQWYQPGTGFVAKLDAALQRRGSLARCWAHCQNGEQIFHWSGENSWIARSEAASALTNYVARIRADGWRCHIVAHSHGGNIVADALPQIFSAEEPGQPWSKVVTLGTPFIDTTSPIAEKLEWRQRNMNAIFVILFALLVYQLYDLANAYAVVYETFGKYYSIIIVAWALVVYAIFFYRAWRLQWRRWQRSKIKYWVLESSFWIIAGCIFFLLYDAAIWLFEIILWSPKDVPYFLKQLLLGHLIYIGNRAMGNMALLVVLIPVLLIADRVRRKLGRKGLSGVWSMLDDSTQERPALFAISSRVDEAWQILFHLRNSSSPLTIRRPLAHIASSVGANLWQSGAVARIFGARSYSDLRPAAKFATASAQLLAVFILIYLVGDYYWRGHGQLPKSSFNLLNYNIMLPFIGFLILSFAMTLSESVVSVSFSPLRWLFRFAGALGAVPREIGMLLVRAKGWPMLMKIAMGLDGYLFSIPPVEQFPRNIAEKLVKYESMPKGAEERALERRSAWVARHLGSVSETFSKLAVTAADLTALLRTVEEDQSLVHAAYYTDEECISRIADWIAGADMPNSKPIGDHTFLPSYQ